MQIKLIIKWGWSPENEAAKRFRGLSVCLSVCQSKRLISWVGIGYWISTGKWCECVDTNKPPLELGNHFIPFRIMAHRNEINWVGTKWIVWIFIVWEFKSFSNWKWYSITFRMSAYCLQRISAKEMVNDRDGSKWWLTVTGKRTVL